MAAAVRLRPAQSGATSTCRRRARRCRATSLLGRLSGRKQDPAPTAQKQWRRWPPTTGSSIALGLRPTQEDATCIKTFSKCLYAAVFDGHAGSTASSYLKQRLHQTLAKRGVLRQAAFVPLDEDALRAAFVEAFAAEDANLLRSERVAGACATTVLVTPSHVCAAGVGDCKAVLSRTENAAIDLTDDHRLVGPTATARDERRRVVSSGGFVADGRVCGILAVSRAFGDWDFKADGIAELRAELLEDEVLKERASRAALDQGLVSVEPCVKIARRSPTDEFVIVGSDGLFDVTSTSNAVGIVRRELDKGGTAATAAAALVSHATQQRKAQDNVSVIVIDLRAARYASS